jgi:NADH-quinone oxidoreductase subunit C
MEQQQIQSLILEKFPNHGLSFDESSDMLIVTTEKTLVVELIRFLKDQLGYEFLTDLCGIHYPDREFSKNARIRVKTYTSIEVPEIDSITEIFSAANWMERETYDFFGIVFRNHPNLVRILNVEYLDYFPLRKEYPLEDQTRTDKDNRFFGR